MEHPVPDIDLIHTGIIIVDHGSRREESNRMLLDVVALFVNSAAEVPEVPGVPGVPGAYGIVEPAHMELAEPSIATAFDACVRRGARRVVVMPYFLLPGRHWDQDIPRLAAAAAANHPGIEFLVAAPLGLHPLLAQLIRARIDHCLAHAAGKAAECDVCAGTGRCVMRGGGRRVLTPGGG